MTLALAMTNPMDNFVDKMLETTDRALDQQRDERDAQVASDLESPPPSPALLTVGIVMTNQARKDWGLAAAICAGLVTRLPNIRFWWHLDTQLRHWSIPALLADYDLDSSVEVTTPPMDDHTLAARYRTCNLTLLPSLGEGYGYPIFESFACGVPCLHGNYGGGASLMESCGLEYYLVQPTTFRMDTQQNCVRPVYDAGDWIDHALEILQPKGGVDPVSQQVAHLSWMKLAHPWRKWLRDGLG